MVTVSPGRTTRGSSTLGQATGAGPPMVGDPAGTAGAPAIGAGQLVGTRGPPNQRTARRTVAGPPNVRRVGHGSPPGGWVTATSSTVDPPDGTSTGPGGTA